MSINQCQLRLLLPLGRALWFRVGLYTKAPGSTTATRSSEFLMMVSRFQLNIGRIIPTATISTKVSTWGPTGFSTIRDSGPAYWAKEASLPTDGAICKWLLDNLAVPDADDDTIANKSLKDTFVEPNLVMSKKEASSLQSSEQSVSVQQIISGEKHFVIAADYEFGATSLLKQLRSQMYQKCRTAARAQVPVLIDAKKLQPYRGRIDAVLRAGLPESNEQRFKLQSIHDSGHLTILIDDFEPAEHGEKTTLTAITNFYPKARIIVVAKLPAIYLNNVEPIVGLVEPTLVQIRPLKRRNVRSLVGGRRFRRDYQRSYREGRRACRQPL